jgi:hypothetical protein
MPKEKFVVEENLNSVREGAVSASNVMVKTSNRKGDSLIDDSHVDVFHPSTLTFDLPPPLEEEEEYSLRWTTRPSS